MQIVKKYIFYVRPALTGGASYRVARSTWPRLRRFEGRQGETP